MAETESRFQLTSEAEDLEGQRRARRQNFLGYYNRELSYLRHLGAEFRRNHGEVASRLKLEDEICDDPHVERLLESFAFLAARIHNRIDDEFPEITGALLEELYPAFTRPVPSVSLVEFQTDPERGKQTAGRKIPRETSLESNPPEGFVCKVRTCYDTELWPVFVEQASCRPGSILPSELTRLPTSAVIELKLSCSPDLTFSALGLNHLRFYLNGENDVVYPLYELLLGRCHTVVVHDGAGPTSPAAFKATVKAAGFDEREGLSWDKRNRRTFSGYNLLQDYFSFPQKYLFVDVDFSDSGGLSKLNGLGPAREIKVLFLIAPFERSEWRPVLEQRVSAKTFRLNCTPIINLFPAVSDPIPLRTNVYELPVPIGPRAETYSIDEVYGATVGGSTRTPFGRYIDCGNTDTGTEYTGYWNAVRRPSRREENVSEMFISLIDRTGEKLDPRVDTLTARVTCTNRDWPFRLPMNQPNGDFHMQQYPEIQKIVCLRPPSKGFPAAASRTSMWRLLSQLSLNHLSLIADGRNALQCLLRVHNLAELEFGEENIKAIRSLKSWPDFARVSSDHGMAFVRGRRVEIVLDETRFATSGAFLFGSVLERFLGLYTSLNSFSQLTLMSASRGEKPIHTWAPRAGSKVVV